MLVEDEVFVFEIDLIFLVQGSVGAEGKSGGLAAPGEIQDVSADGRVDAQ